MTGRILKRLGRICMVCAFASAFILMSWQAQAQVQEQVQGETGAGADDLDSVSGIDKILSDEQLLLSLREMYQRRSKVREPDVDMSQIGSLFFTMWQHSLLREARVRGASQSPDDVDMPSAGSGMASESGRGPREISLGGIAYAGPKNWTIWLNGTRITPEGIPKEIIDISVKRDFIEVKWFDAFTNLIYPVKLRAHQRFNLDNRIFLPGEGVPQ